MKCRPWNIHEDEFLKDNYGKVPPRFIAKQLNRSASSVMHRAFNLGIHGTRASHVRNKTWTNEEERLLIENYSKMDWSELSNLTGHTRHAIRNRASKLGVPRDLEIPDITDLDAAYLAGLIDGEGSIMINCHHTGLLVSGTMVKVSISSTSLELLSEVRDFFLLQAENQKPPELVHYHNAAAKPNHKTGYLLGIGGKNRTKKVLERLLPYLRLKKPQAEVALEYLRTHREKSLTLRDLKLALKIRFLNHSTRLPAIESRKLIEVMVRTLETLEIDLDIDILSNPTWVSHCQEALEKECRKC